MSKNWDDMLAKLTGNPVTYSIRGDYDVVPPGKQIKYNAKLVPKDNKLTVEEAYKRLVSGEPIELVLTNWERTYVEADDESYPGDNPHIARLMEQAWTRTRKAVEGDDSMGHLTRDMGHSDLDEGVTIRRGRVVRVRPETDPDDGDFDDRFDDRDSSDVTFGDEWKERDRDDASQRIVHSHRVSDFGPQLDADPPNQQQGKFNSVGQIEYVHVLMPSKDPQYSVYWEEDAQGYLLLVLSTDDVAIKIIMNSDFAEEVGQFLTHLNGPRFERRKKDVEFLRDVFGV